MPTCKVYHSQDVTSWKVTWIDWYTVSVIMMPYWIFTDDDDHNQGCSIATHHWPPTTTCQPSVGHGPWHTKAQNSQTHCPNITSLIWLVTCSTWSMTHDVWHVTWHTWLIKFDSSFLWSELHGKCNIIWQIHWVLHFAFGQSTLFPFKKRTQCMLKTSFYRPPQLAVKLLIINGFLINLETNHVLVLSLIILHRGLDTPNEHLLKSWQVFVC